jgi:hypothetical protein
VSRTASAALLAAPACPTLCSRALSEPFPPFLPQNAAGLPGEGIAEYHPVAVAVTESDEEDAESEEEGEEGGRRCGDGWRG